MVSLCFSAFVVDKTHAIDIETLEEHKRRNYGRSSSGICTGMSSKGIRPYWDCTPENTGSIRLAEKVGMTLILTTKYPGMAYPNGTGTRSSR